MQVKKFSVTIQGTAPLLMHRFDEQSQAELEGEVKKAKMDPGTSEEQAERAAYRFENGNPNSNLYLSAEALYNAAVKAAGGLKVKGGRGASYRAAIQGNLIVEPDYADLGVSTYVVDKRRAKVQGRACMRSRPRLDKWQVTFEVCVLDEDAIPDEVLNQVLADAGQKVGVLDYRPRFGRFMVTEFKAV